MAVISSVAFPLYASVSSVIQSFDFLSTRTNLEPQRTQRRTEEMPQRLGGLVPFIAIYHASDSVFKMHYVEVDQQAYMSAA